MGGNGSGKCNGISNGGDGGGGGGDGISSSTSSSNNSASATASVGYGSQRDGGAVNEGGRSILREFSFWVACGPTGKVGWQSGDCFRLLHRREK